MTDTRVVEPSAEGARTGGAPSTVLRDRAPWQVLVLDDVRPAEPTIGRPRPRARAIDDGVDVDAVVRRPRRPARALPWALVLGVLAAVAVAGVTLLGVQAPLLALAGVVVGLLVVHRVLVDPWHVRWGATRSEACSSMPGDELLDDAVVTTRAVTIDAPVAQVWSWIVELGMGPDGWSSPGLIPDERSRGGIVPALGDLGGGRRRPAPGAGFEVLRIEAPRTVVSRGHDGTTWCLQLGELGGGRTRLVSRFRSTLSAQAGTPPVLADPLQFVRERRMLRGLRSRAEAGAPLPRRASPCAP